MISFRDLLRGQLDEVNPGAAGLLLREWRHRLQISRADLAEELTATQIEANVDQVAAWERGEGGGPPPSVGAVLAGLRYRQGRPWRYLDHYLWGRWSGAPATEYAFFRRLPARIWIGTWHQEQRRERVLRHSFFLLLARQWRKGNRTAVDLPAFVESWFVGVDPAAPGSEREAFVLLAQAPTRRLHLLQRQVWCPPRQGAVIMRQLAEATLQAAASIRVFSASAARIFNAPACIACFGDNLDPGPRPRGRAAAEETWVVGARPAGSRAFTPYTWPTPPRGQHQDAPPPRRRQGRSAHRRPQRRHR